MASFRQNNRFFERIKQGVTVTFSSDVTIPAEHHSIPACLLIAIYGAMGKYPYANQRVVRTWWGGTRIKQYSLRDISIVYDSDGVGDAWVWGQSTIPWGDYHSGNLDRLLMLLTEQNVPNHVETAVVLDLTDKTGVDAAVAAWPWPVSFSFGQVRKDHQMTIVMNFDRRIMAGAPAAKFFSAVLEGFNQRITREIEVPLPLFDKEPAQ